MRFITKEFPGTPDSGGNSGIEYLIIAPGLVVTRILVVNYQI